MNGLLCAIMIGTRCMMWHPTGTILPGSVEAPWAHGNTINGMGHYYVSYTGVLGGGARCRFGDIARAIAVKHPGVEVEFSCTRDEENEADSRYRCEKRTPLERSYTNGECK